MAAMSDLGVGLDSRYHASGGGTQTIVDLFVVAEVALVERPDVLI